MIPSTSLFSHLHCGFGSRCDRPYCIYFHPGLEPPTRQAFDREEVSSYKYAQEDEASNSMNIVQEEVNYDEFAYQAYVGQLNQQPVDDFPNYEPFPGTEQLQVYQQEDIGQFIPTKPTSTSVSKPVQKPPVKKRNHEYSVLNDKKKLPIDLGNDEILLSLSAAHKQGQQEPEKKKQRNEPIPTINTIRLKTGPSKSYVPSSAAANKNGKVKPKNSTIESKLTSATNAFAASIQAERESQLNTGKMKSDFDKYGPPSSSSYVPTKVSTASSNQRCEIEVSVKSSRVAHSQTYQSKNVPKGIRPAMITPKARLAQVQQMPPPLPATGPSIDMEKELREIEILERKTQLLREYKQLAQEIAEIEAKKPSYYDSNSIRALFGDDDDVQSSSTTKERSKFGK